MPINNFLRFADNRMLGINAFVQRWENSNLLYLYSRKVSIENFRNFQETFPFLFLILILYLVFFELSKITKYVMDYRVKITTTCNTLY